MLLSLTVCSGATAQWNPVASPTKANLLGVHASDDFVWISGEGGTVLHSIDKGATFTPCSVPKGAEHAALRSIQGIDADTAVAMSSGKGERSVLYRTADGCKTWKEVLVNPEPTASFDSLRRVTAKQMYLLSEPVAGKFVLYLSQDGGSQWFVSDDPGLEAFDGETAAASTLLSQGPFLYFGTTSSDLPRVHFTAPSCPDSASSSCPVVWNKAQLAAVGASDVGVHAVAVQSQTSMATGKIRFTFAAVGGSLKDPSLPFAATSADGTVWTAAVASTHGDRSAVMMDQATQTLVAVGANGTDISKDYGKHWQAVQSNVEQGWTALSLPFAVGVQGRIGMLQPQSALR
ncbi:MAG: WD40/YVTN/BNR-like repeat-containing protein [Janthinobacterium lividum]